MRSNDTPDLNFLSKVPVISILTTAASLIIFICSEATALLQYDRALIKAGEIWRLLTGHWTHWSFDHFLWCTITFFVLGSICEKLNKTGFLVSLVSSAVIIPAVIWIAAPHMLFYRGLSGICSSIFITCSILLARRALLDKDWMNFLLPLVGGCLFLIKIIYEYISGQALFVQNSDIFTPVPLAHLTGGITGLIAAVYTLFKSERHPTQSLQESIRIR